MSKIVIKKTAERICHCANCTAKNFEYNDSKDRYPLKSNGTIIYEVRVGVMVLRLCPDCLAELIGKATVALAIDK